MMALLRVEHLTKSFHGNKAVDGAFIVADLGNGGINTVGQAVAEAAKAIGWEVGQFDGKGRAQGRTQALNQATAMRPLGVVLGGLDATEEASTAA
jgi:ribose transport system substrate-binding protein